MTSGLSSDTLLYCYSFIRFHEPLVGCGEEIHHPMCSCLVQARDTCNFPESVHLVFVHGLRVLVQHSQSLKALFREQSVSVSTFCSFSESEVDKDSWSPSLMLYPSIRVEKMFRVCRIRRSLITPNRDKLIRSSFLL
ncbi:hypothetical protein Tco_0129465 [Tanacetum coccineum]